MNLVGFSKFKQRSVQRLPRLARIAFLSVVRIKSSARSCMHIYAHISRRIMRPRVIYRAGTRALVYIYISRNFPSVLVRPTVEAGVYFCHSFFSEGARTRFSSFDGNPVVSDQRQPGTYPLLSALVCSFVRCLRSVTSFPNVFPLVSSRVPFYAVWHGSSGISEKLWAKYRERARYGYLLSTKETLSEIETFLGNFCL